MDAILLCDKISNNNLFNCILNAHFQTAQVKASTTLTILCVLATYNKSSSKPAEFTEQFYFVSLL